MDASVWILNLVILAIVLTATALTPPRAIGGAVALPGA